MPSDIFCAANIYIVTGYTDMRRIDSKVAGRTQ